MAMTTDSRAAFEYWARSKGLDVTRWNERKRGPLPNEYMKLDTDMAWSGWQARHHLTQPAQAVDVGAIREVIDVLNDVVRTAPMSNFSRSRVGNQVDKLTRALSGEKAGPVGDGWQPIETAPKDGTRVLTYAPKRTWATQHIAINHFKQGVWQHCNSECPPTHWQPLPASPTPGKEG